MPRFQNVTEFNLYDKVKLNFAPGLVDVLRRVEIDDSFPLSRVNATRGNRKIFRFVSYIICLFGFCWIVVFLSSFICLLLYLVFVLITLLVGILVNILKLKIQRTNKLRKIFSGKNIFTQCVTQS